MELISIRKLNNKHLLDLFDCGVYELNEYLKRYALKNDHITIEFSLTNIDYFITFG